jgi:hypothetical protein
MPSTMDASDLAALQARAEELAGDIERAAGPQLHGLYLDLVTFLGTVTGAVHEAQRSRRDDMGTAHDALDRAKGSARQVGLDIRLASEPALRMGLSTAIEQAREALDLIAAE